MRYARDVDARKSLRRAARRIMEADERYELVDVQRRLSWGILARRVPGRERREARTTIRQSLGL
jgi:hypothetical protein